MKMQVTTDEHAALPENMQSEYTSTDDGYQLNVEGGEDVGALKRGKDRANQERKDSVAKLKDLQTKYTDLEFKFDEMSSKQEPGSKDKPDVLQSAYEAKLREKDKSYSDRIKKLNSEIAEGMIDTATNKMSMRLFGKENADLLQHHVKDRYTVDHSDDGSKLSILDPDGSKGIMNDDDMYQEFVANKRFSKYIVASRASGGGGGKDHVGSATKNLKDLTMTERSAYAKKNNLTEQQYRDTFHNK